MATIVYTTISCQRLTMMRAKKIPSEILRTITVAMYVTSLAIARCSASALLSGESSGEASYLGEVVQLGQIGDMGATSVCFNVKNASAKRRKDYLPYDTLLWVRFIAQVDRTPARIIVPSSHPKFGLMKHLVHVRNPINNHDKTRCAIVTSRSRSPRLTR